MTFVCENCGWRDDPRWRNAYWDPDISIMNWSDFRVIYPDLGPVLEIRRFISKGPYVYERVPLGKFPTRFIRRGTSEIWESRNRTFHLKPKMESKGRKKIRQKTTMDHLNPSTRGKAEILHPRERIGNWLSRADDGKHRLKVSQVPEATMHTSSSEKP